MVLVNSIVNDYTTHFAYMLLGDNQVFVYDNGIQLITTLEQYLKKVK